MHLFAQVNTSITVLNLEGNELDAEAKEALGKALKVSPMFVVNSHTLNVCVFFHVLADSPQSLHESMTPKTIL
jgi:hypothetical protein